MKLKLLSPEELKFAYEEHLTEAFPPAELKPLSAMENLRRQGIYDPLAMLDDEGEPQGYILLWKHVDGKYILIDYLCVPVGRRNGGIGGKLLRAVRKRYPKGMVLLAESEAPGADSGQNELAGRRLAFYERNGAVTLGYDCALFGVHFKTLCWADPLPPEEAILRKHQEIYLRQFGQERYNRYVQIPLAAGEKPYPLTDWTEED